jgi:hypothetical protein
MSYHDLYITTNGIKRTSIFNLPFNVVVTCTRAGGWEVWDTHVNGFPVRGDRWTLMGGEYSEEKPLRLDVKGTTVVDSFKEKE